MPGEPTKKPNLGIKKVRFRPHPSENPSWYLKFLDLSFFKLDTVNLEESLKKSTLVIGPSSTVLLEALYFDVNYVVYEPSQNNISLMNDLLYPPFDGAYPEIPVAKNEDDLKSILENKRIITYSVIHKFIKTPFNLDFIKDLIKK